MVGQSFPNARRVVVLIQGEGFNHAWEVLEPDAVKWDLTGVGRARVVVAGTFHRITRYGTIEAEVQHTIELENPR